MFRLKSDIGFSTLFVAINSITPAAEWLCDVSAYGGTELVP